MRELVIATKNRKKLRELKRYLKGVRANVISLLDIERPPRIIEDGDTFVKNAVKKAVTVSKFTGALALADDSGLEVKALGNRPGVKSARFAGPGKKDIDNNIKLLGLLAGLPSGKRRARFVCAVAIADKGKVVKIIEGKCGGRIAFSMRGRHGFGYDSLFVAEGHKKTFGELGLKMKDRMSHRSKALKKAREFLRRYI